ncbi:MAG: polymorphic toxin type 23 domain-containing protein [Crocinitomicaceae bacterium]|nr:hypothetical protein [Crocinitomicaceae bacterium]
MKRLIPFIIFFQFLLGHAQEGTDSFYGVSAGISFSFGTHINRLGFHAAGYYNYAFAQANASFNGYYNFRSLALKEKGWEWQLGTGIEFGFGRRDTVRSPFIGLTENNMRQDYSVGYNYLMYFDQQQTTQTSGILDINVLDFKFATENDLFGFGDGWRDRYRTGAFLLEYRYQNFKFGINSTLWTDDYTVCKKVLDTEYPARFGYKDDNKVKFCGESIGLLSAQVKYLAPVPTNFWPAYQEIQMNIGVDAEQVRNVLQNKMIHDHYPIPTKFIKRNPCHIPMEEAGGGQFLYLDGQKVEPVKFYFNLGTNQGVFY